MASRVFLTVWVAVLFLITLSIFEQAFFGTSKAQHMRDLRNGLPVKFEAGLCGRINLKNKTLELSSGQVVYVGDDPDFFPSSLEELRLIEAREAYQSNHPISYEIRKFYDENCVGISLIFGCVVFIFFIWKLIVFLIRKMFFTATKAIKDAKEGKY